MNYKELLKNRRSIRDYEDKAVSEGIINEILNDACQAPSARNMQPWRFVVISDKNLIKKISDESKKNILDDIYNNKNFIHKPIAERLKNEDYNVFYNAPCLIIISGKNDYPFWFHYDCALCAAYLMFAATERNLGTCWISLGIHIRDASLRKKIGLPDDYEVIAPIILGYPKQITEPTKRSAPIILPAPSIV